MKLYAFNGMFDTMPGFPVELGVEVRAAVAVTDTVSPEIVVLTADGRLWLLGPDGEVRDGFPVELSNVPYYNTGQPVVGDFDRDSTLEIAVIAGSEFDNRLFVIGLDGTVEYRSREIVRQPYAGPMAAADVSGDGYPDLLAASMNELFAFNRNATLADNYPFRQDSTFLTYELAGNWIIYYDTYFSYTSAPAVADFDNDGLPDIAIGSPRYGVLGFDGRTGDALARFPLMTTAPVSAVPLAADLDRDGDVELCVGAEDGIFHVWDLEVPADGIRWPCAYHDPCHTGLLRADELGTVPGVPDGLVGSYFIYPNPAGTKAVVRYRLNRAAAAVKISLLDIAAEPTGVELDGPTLGNADNELELDLADVDPGLYVLRLAVDDGSTQTVEFTKLAVVR
jgi:hypothetical protein